MSKSWLVFCGLFSTVGIVCLSIGFNVWNKNRAFKKTGVETTAVVIGHHKKKQIPATTAQAVILQYATKTEEYKIFYSTTYTTPPLFQVGEQVKIWYQLDQPENVLMEGKDEWLVPMILFGFGTIFSLIGVPGFIRELMKR